MSNPGFSKRQKEKDRQARARDKEIERERRKAEKLRKGSLPGGEDPDIAGIVPGPQPQDEDPST
jgi:hypothetical protein